MASLSITAPEGGQPCSAGSTEGACHLYMKLQPEQYRPIIDECIGYLEWKLGVRCDGSVKNNRHMCRHLVDSMLTEYPEADPVVCIKRIVNIAMSDHWHRDKSTNFGYLYRNRARLILLGLEQKRLQVTKVAIPDTPKYKTEGKLRKWD